MEELLIKLFLLSYLAKWRVSFLFAVSISRYLMKRKIVIAMSVFDHKLEDYDGDQKFGGFSEKFGSDWVETIQKG